jgi:predicted phosphodiesterase
VAAVGGAKPSGEGWKTIRGGPGSRLFGHSHKPSIETRSGVLYINPGSAGPPRFRLPVTVGRVRITGRKIEPEIVQLDVR